MHGYCLAGGTELASACDLVYVSENARIGYPPVRLMGLPDTQVFPWLCGMRGAMELMLTGDSMTGQEAVEKGFANRVYPNNLLEAAVLEKAKRVAKVPSDIQQYNKRSVHRAMEVMGLRTALRQGTDLQALSFYQKSSREIMAKFTGENGATAKAFQGLLIFFCSQCTALRVLTIFTVLFHPPERDKAFGDNRVALHKGESVQATKRSGSKDSESSWGKKKKDLPPSMRRLQKMSGKEEELLEDDWRNEVREMRARRKERSKLLPDFR